MVSTSAKIPSHQNGSTDNHVKATVDTCLEGIDSSECYQGIEIPAETCLLYGNVLAHSSLGFPSLSNSEKDQLITPKFYSLSNSGRVALRNFHLDDLTLYTSIFMGPFEKRRLGF